MTNVVYENKRMLEVVNESDEVIDSKPRSEIHRLGLLHREIHVWMFDENHNIIFQKRGLHSQSAGLLDATVGGHANAGEDYIDTAVREVKEETGMTISPSDLALLTKFREKSSLVKEDYLGTVNNFIRVVYIYK